MILNTFPDLLTFSMLSPFILRIVIALIALNLGFLKLGKEKMAWENLFELIKIRPARIFVKILSFVEIVGACALLTGTYTQLTGMVFSVLFFCEAVLEYRESSLEKRNLTFYLLMLAISLSLVFSGAGAFAFDIRL